LTRFNLYSLHICLSIYLSSFLHVPLSFYLSIIYLLYNI
jgi:hypothetical protein